MSPKSMRADDIEKREREDVDSLMVFWRSAESVSAILALVVSVFDWVQVAMTTCTNPESLANWNTEL